MPSLSERNHTHRCPACEKRWVHLMVEAMDGQPDGCLRVIYLECDACCDARTAHETNTHAG